MTKRRRLKAFHEAGHAVIARTLGLDVHSISMRSNSDGAAAYVQTHSASWLAQDVSDKVMGCEKDCKVALAGIIVMHNLRLGSIKSDDPQFEDDIQNAQGMVGNIVWLLAGNSLPEASVSVVLSDDMQREGRVIFDRILREATALVAEHWPAIERVAKAMERHDRLDQAELDRLIAVAQRQR